MNKDGIERQPVPGVAEATELRVWQTPDMEIVLVSATASGRGAQCEGSVFTNTS